jgi:hypothetical protein
MRKEAGMKEYNWGPTFIVPSEVLNKLSGIVRLREEFDEELLDKELGALGISGVIEKVTNPWYYRRKGTETWIKVGESEDKADSFGVTWDTSKVQNGKYEVLGLMHVFVRKDGSRHAIARQNIVEVTVQN